MRNDLTVWGMRIRQEVAGIALCQARICGSARCTGTCADRFAGRLAAFVTSAALRRSRRGISVSLSMVGRERDVNNLRAIKQKRPGLSASGPGKELISMKCVFCEREVADAGNWLKIHLWAGFAIFHWSCFAEFFKHNDEAKVENAVSRAEHNQ